MSKPTTNETNLLRSRPHRSKLWLSVYQPTTTLACQVTGSHSRGDYEISFDTVSEGSTGIVEAGMTMFVGSSAGAFDKGMIRVRSITSTVITVAENSDISWSDDDYLTIIRFFEINAVYPRIIPDPADEENTLWYKDYDIAYSNQNTDLGTFVCMGSHYAGFTEDDIYYTASGTSNLKGQALAYDWVFEGADTTGSSSHTPGYIAYSTPGHYTTKLTATVTGTSITDVSYRHVSIYDRPEDGTNVPILNWEIESLGGSRGAGGYNANVKIFQSVPESLVRDGSLIVLFADDDYDGTIQSIGGNALNRSSIFFVGYVVDGSIQYNWRDSTVEFQVGSPSEIMKLTEGFSISVQDSSDVDASVTARDEIPSGWVVILEMDNRRAMYHYLRWHSTVLLCNDFEFLGTDRRIQYYDSDRESVYDAIANRIRSALLGEIVCDRQGKVWAETDIYHDTSPYQTNITIQKRDWMNDPSIDQESTRSTSFIEIGGIAYSGASTGTFSALLCAVPGNAPSYRGKVDRQQGLALADQDQLNQLAGDLFNHRNAEFPDVQFELAGNYRNFDIAPQEIVPIDIASDDTLRELVWDGKNFYINSIQWRFDLAKQWMNPTIIFGEITSGVAGDTLIIPDVPPSEGFHTLAFNIPDIQIPPYPAINIDTLSFYTDFVPVKWGFDGSVAVDPDFGSWGQIILSTTSNLAQATGYILVAEGFSGTLTATPLIFSPSSGQGAGNVYMRRRILAVTMGDATAHDTTDSGYTQIAFPASGDAGYNWIDDAAVTVGNVLGNDLIQLECTRDGDHGSDTYGVDVRIYGWKIEYNV